MFDTCNSLVIFPDIFKWEISNLNIENINISFLKNSLSELSLTEKDSKKYNSIETINSDNISKINYNIITTDYFEKNEDKNIIKYYDNFYES